MLVNKAYCGNQFCYRAYFNGMIIWDYSLSTCGNINANIDVNLYSSQSSPNDVMMSAYASNSLSGSPEVHSFTEAYGNILPEAYMIAYPSHIPANHGIANIILSHTGLACAVTYQFVWACGQQYDDLMTLAILRQAESVHTVAKLNSTESYVNLTPDTNSPTIISLSSGFSSENKLTSVDEELCKVEMRSSNYLYASLCSSTLPVHTITFMNQGEIIHQETIIEGYVCQDPVKDEKIETPTKQQTISHVFSYSGWSLSPDGMPDDSALDAIYADRVVYAAFEATLRNYTVRFFDEDVLVDTVICPYGETAVTSYVRDGYNYATWFPSNENIIGDTDCYGKFEFIHFADSSWDKIITVAQNGLAASSFTLGEEKEFTLTYPDGTTEDNVFVVAGYDDCELVDRTRSNLVLVAKHALEKLMVMNDKYVNYGLYYDNSSLDSYVSSNIYEALPESLKFGVKECNIDGPNSWLATVRKCWIPSLEELQLYKKNYTELWCKPLPLFTTASARIKTQGKYGDPVGYWVRNANDNQPSEFANFASVDETGDVYGGTNTGVHMSYNSDLLGVVICVCL